MRDTAGLRWYALIGVIAIILATLAWLQYQSIRQLSQTSAGQMLATLEASLMDFRQGVERELSPVCQQFSIETDLNRRRALLDLENDFVEWRRRSAHPRLVADVYVWRGAGTSRAKLLQVNPGSDRFEAIPWPEDALVLRDKLLGITKTLGNPHGNHGDATRPDAVAHPFSWFIDQRIGMLAYAIAPDPELEYDAPATWVLVRLDRETLWDQVLPEIAQRSFVRDSRALDQFAFAGGTLSKPLVLSMSGNFANASAKPDASLNIFGRPQLRLRNDTATTARGPLLPPAATGSPEHSIRIEPISEDDDAVAWKILGNAEMGSIDAAVRRLFYRSLATNSGVLLLLTVAIISLVVGTQRARQLSRMQVDFVANVSHELRTPLTGISTAAQNIADGVVQDPNKLVAYGNHILKQSHQLSELVEQILLFSATQKRRHRYLMEPVAVQHLVRSALDRSSAALKNAGTTVDVRLQPELSPVNVDPKAMTQCLHNLITNAVKYGGEARWIGIRAMESGENGDREIRISVEDRGIGISPDQLKLIFEPFYRTPDVTAAQIHGNGVGLPLARNITEAMGGRLTVESKVREGSTFTVHLPAFSRETNDGE